MTSEQIDSIKNVLIKNVLATCWEFAEETEDRTEYGCDVHHYLFNRKHYTDYIAVAESDTADLGVWDCVRLVQNYERAHFGETNTEIRPFQIANMVNYILGYHLLGKSEHLTNSDAWDRELTAKDRTIIQIELRAYIKGLANWQQFWEEVLKEYDV